MSHELDARWVNGRLYVDGVERQRFEGDIEYYKKVARHYTTLNGIETRNKNIAEHYKKGRKILDLCVDYGISKQIVCEILKKQGVTLLDARPPIPPERNQNIYNRWVAGETQTALAEEYKLSKTRIQIICRKFVRKFEKEKRFMQIKKSKKVNPPLPDIIDTGVSHEVWTPEMQAVEFEFYRDMDIT
jgi:Mor family transcriptional regulator